jgi:hypothetical protein
VRTPSTDWTPEEIQQGARIIAPSDSSLKHWQKVTCPAGRLSHITVKVANKMYHRLFGIEEYAKNIN